MKIKPNYERAAQRALWHTCYAYSKHKPSNRLRRNHYKNCNKVRTELRLLGHSINQWHYWYGQSTFYCEKCKTAWHLAIGKKQLENLSVCQTN